MEDNTGSIEKTQEFSDITKRSIKKKLPIFYYPAFLVAFINLALVYIGQPLTYWSDFSKHNVAEPFNYLVEPTPLLYLLVYIVYLWLLRIFLMKLPQLIAHVTAGFAFIFHVYFSLSWVPTLLLIFEISKTPMNVLIANMIFMSLLAGTSILLLLYPKQISSTAARVWDMWKVYIATLLLVFAMFGLGFLGSVHLQNFGSEKVYIVDVEEVANVKEREDITQEVEDPKNANEVTKNVDKIYVVNLPDKLFKDDYSNKAMCLGEWQDIVVYMPYSAKNANMVLIEDSPVGTRLGIHRFITRAENSTKIEEETFRWRTGEHGSGFVEVGVQYRLEFGGTFVSGYQDESEKSYFQGVTEPFLLVDCGT